MMITNSGVTLYNDGQFPQIRVTVRKGEEKLYDVDDRRSTMKRVQKLMETAEESEKDELILQTVLGEKAAKEICDSDISMRDYNTLVRQIMSIITGESVEQLEANAKNA